MFRYRLHLRPHGYWTLLGILTIVCGAPMNDDLSTVQKLQHTIKAMESLLEKQQQRMLSGFEGMRRRVNALEKIADKTRKEIEHSADAICPSLTAPIHGRVLGGKRRSQGDLAYYVCGPGYEMKGNEEVVCLENGTWSGRKPVCSDATPLSMTGERRKSDCDNVDGEMHVCTCPVGFQLSKDQTTCIDVDECANFRNGGKCLNECRNLPGSYQCICPSGYNVDKIQGCRDIDECASEHTNNCSSPTECLNTGGGFQCISTDCPRHYIKTGARSLNRPQLER
uniref:fibulin-7-like isoform X2 n=1 Tax=Styela clava TaxID=7725 RepID=UPI001939C0CF|nr:fibulin-7-like isoform X2 [Styela clava]